MLHEDWLRFGEIIPYYVEMVIWVGWETPESTSWYGVLLIRFCYDCLYVKRLLTEHENVEWDVMNCEEYTLLLKMTVNTLSVISWTDWIDSLKVINKKKALILSTHIELICFEFIFLLNPWLYNNHYNHIIHHSMSSIKNKIHPSN